MIEFLTKLCALLRDRHSLNIHSAVWMWPCAHSSRAERREIIVQEAMVTARYMWRSGQQGTTSTPSTFPLDDRRFVYGADQLTVRGPPEGASRSKDKRN
jgi:hypothetical protein